MSASIVEVPRTINETVEHQQATLDPTAAAFVPLDPSAAVFVPARTSEPPLPRANSAGSENPSEILCRNWEATGRCFHGDRCRFRHVSAPAPAPTPAPAPVFNVFADTSVITDQLSDHAWPRFVTAESCTLISANIMCSGEKHDPAAANSFRAHPKDWHRRYEGIVQALQRNASEVQQQQGHFPVIAIQEFPRQNRRYQIEARRLLHLLQLAFPEEDGWSMHFGEKDEPSDDFAQLCVIVPPGCCSQHFNLPAEAVHWCTHGGQYGPSRFQVVQVTVGSRHQPADGFALINIHPGPGGQVPEILSHAALRLLQSPNVSAVHIVGDWNRPAEAWQIPPQHNELLVWSELQSPPPRSHLVGAARQVFNEVGVPTKFAYSPIDLYVSVRASPTLSLIGSSSDRVLL